MDKLDARVELSEYLPARFAAMGASYWSYLMMALLRWSAVWVILCALYVLARWVGGSAPWWDTRGLKAVAFAAIVGAAIRTLIEAGPREMTIDDQGVALHHTNWNHRQFRVSAIARIAMVQLPGNRVRVEVTQLPDGSRPIVVGTDIATGQQLDRFLRSHPAWACRIRPVG